MSTLGISEEQIAALDAEQKAGGPGQNGGRPQQSKYAPSWRDGNNGKRSYVLASLPPDDDLANNLEWLTLTLGLDPRRPITAALRLGTFDADGSVVLTRAGGAPELRFAPFARMCTPAKLLETLNACMDSSDGIAPPITGEHIPPILAAVRRVTDASERVTACERFGAIVRTFIADAHALPMGTRPSTSAERYELAKALSRPLDDFGRPTDRPRCVVDPDTDELLIRASDLAVAARTFEGTSLRRGELQALIAENGWRRVTIDGHALPGGAGRRGPHARVYAYRGQLATDDQPDEEPQPT
jgi:hypothetical protein